MEKNPFNASKVTRPFHRVVFLQPILDNIPGRNYINAFTRRIHTGEKPYHADGGLVTLKNLL